MNIFNLFRKPSDEVADYKRQMDQRRAAQAPASPAQAAPIGAVLLQVEDVFTITGRGTVVTGRCSSAFASGDSVLLVNPDGTSHPTTIDKIEKFRQMLNSALPGDNVGVLLPRITKAQIQKGAKLYRR